MKARVFRASVIFAMLALSGTAFAQDNRDVRIANEIVTQVQTYPRFTIFDDVTATIENGVVTLFGKVTMPYKKDEIGSRVARVDGVRELQNRIDVLPVSPFDEELRRRIARAIYGNPSFWNYAAMVNPPIHIIVEGGRVRLTGVVNSNVERNLARSLATGFGELSVVNELRTDAEVKMQRATLVKAPLLPVSLPYAPSAK